MAEPIYATASALRTALGVNSTTLSDGTATALLIDAEDAIDGMLGGRMIDPATGRRVVPAAVATWQADKLSRATVKVAALMYGNPTLREGTEQRYRREKGPDFEVEDPIGRSVSPWGSAVDTLIESSGLAQTTAKVSGGGIPLPSESMIVHDNRESDPW